jgi:O-antigen/teichoic acid export membrane protein
MTPPQDAIEPSPKQLVGLRVVQNTATLVAGRVGNAVLGGLSSVLIVRALGSDGFGKFSSLYAYVGLFTWLASVGIEPIVTRESARARQHAGAIVGTGAFICGVSSILAIIVALVLAPLAGFAGKLRLLLILPACELLAFCPLRLVGCIFQVDLKQWYPSAITLARQALWLLVIVGLARTGASLFSFVTARLVLATLEGCLIALAGFMFLNSPPRIVTTDIPRYLRSCAPITMSMLLAGIYLRIDQVMLHKLSSDQALGWYAAAVKVSELFELIPSALLASVFPVLAIAIDNPDTLRRYTDRIFNFLLGTAGLICTFIFVGSESIVRVLYGDQFSPSAHMLSILIWSELAVFFGTAVANLLLALNMQNLLVYPTVGGAVINIALNLWWVPRYSAVGSAWASVVSYTFAWTLVLIPFRQTRAIIAHGLGRAALVLIAAGTATLLSLSLPIPNIFQTIIASIFCFAGMMLLGVIRTADINLLRSALSKGVRPLRT